MSRIGFRLPSRNLILLTACLSLAGWGCKKSAMPPPPPPPSFGASVGPGQQNTEEYSRIEEPGFRSALDNPLSTFSADVDTASYANVRRFLREGKLPPPDAVRIEEMINYFRYSYPEPERSEPLSILTELAACPWQPEHQLLSIGIRAKSISTQDLPPNNLVFLIDVSGSMMPPNKLPLLKRAFAQLVEILRPQDRIALAVYAGRAGLVLPSTPGSEKKKIIEAISALDAGGSTAGGEGIALAYRVARGNFLRNGNNRVILATDGDFNVGVSSTGDLVRLIEKERESGVYLRVLGVGTGNLKDSRMEQLADKGNGNYSYLDSFLEARKVLVQEFGGTLATVAKDVKLQVEFNPAKVHSYRLIGYENRVLRAEDFKDDKKDSGDIGAGHTVTALYELIPAGAKSNVPPSDELRFQKTVVKPGAENAETFFVKVRYKDVQSGEVRELQRGPQGVARSFAEASENLRFAAAVAEFGLLVRGSPFKGASSFDHVIRAVEQTRGPDPEGHRSEFEFLVKTARNLGVAQTGK